MIKFILPLIAVFIATSSLVEAKENVKYQLSTHILDISSGKPAAGIEVKLFRKNPTSNIWEEIDKGITDNNGRIADFLPEGKDNFGIYKLNFATLPYFAKKNMASIYPYVEIVFQIDENTHYHIPLTMSANGYSTYRGN